MKKINVHYSEAWQRFLSYDDGEEIELASNDETGISIMMYVGETRPTVYVSCDDTKLDEEECVSAGDCAETVKYYYDTYLDGTVSDIARRFEEIEEEEVLDPQKEVNERELELEIAVDDFIQTLAPNVSDFVDDYDELLEEILELNFEYLFKVHHLSAYRPAFLKDKDGNKKFTKYPYDQIYGDK